jgi:cobalamin biosynthesis protein CobT
VDDDDDDDDDANEVDGDDDNDNNDRSGGSREGKAFLIPINELPPPNDPRMRYFNDQNNFGERYFGKKALNTKTFKDFKDNVSYIIHTNNTDLIGCE